MAETFKLTCLSCGQANRVPGERLGAGPKCGNCGQPLVPGRPVAVSAAVLDKAIRTDELPLLVDFWAAWCGPCRMMAPEFEKAAAALAPGMRLAKLDTEAHPEVSTRHRISGIPALILFHRGAEKARSAGARPASGIVAFARAAAPAVA